MVNERPRQFPVPPRILPASGSGPAPAGISRAAQLGLGLGKSHTPGIGKAGLKRHRKIPRDTVYGVTKGDIRRLARRGGVKRISQGIYDEVRRELKHRLEVIMKRTIALVEYTGRKTITVTDVVFTLNQLGRPLYGFDPSFDGRHRK